jgi:glutamate synthase (NADPH/NADH) large chain
MERRLINPTRAPRRPTDPHPTDPAPNVKAAAEHGLYAPAYEHDACGVSFVVDLHGRRSHRLVQQALTSLCNLEHRGATGAEENSGDGAGILVGVPDRFLRSVIGAELPPAGHYAAGIGFLPRDDGDARAVSDAIEDLVLDEGLCTIAWRDVPVDPSIRSGIDLDRAAYPLRKRIEHELGQDVGGETVEGVVDRGLLRQPVLAHDRLQGHADHPAAGGVLRRPHRRALRVVAGAGAQPVLDQHLSVLAAGPPVPLHRPQRRDQHGAGQPELDAGPGGDAVDRPDRGRPRPAVFPICTPGASDTARFDEALELLHLGGYACPTPC